MIDQQQLIDDSKPFAIFQASVNLFISHKAEDAKSAREIAHKLTFLGRERLNVFVVEEEPFSTGYWDHTRRQLVQADILVLLYTDPHQEWDAWLYESGFFDGRLWPNNAKRLFVLHAEEVNLRAPLAYFDSVEVSRTKREDLERFLRQVFEEPPRHGVEPINPLLMHEDNATFRNPLEDAIINAVCGSCEHRVFAREVRVEVGMSALEGARDHEVPALARVFGDAPTMGLFGLRERPNGYPWNEFYQGMDGVSDNTSDWAGSLAALMRDIAFSDRDLPSTGLPLYRQRDASGQSRVYRPAIRLFRLKQDVASFTVMFTDLPVETTAERPGAATSLAQALTVARMLRWGVLQDLDDRILKLITRRPKAIEGDGPWQEQVAAEVHRFLGQKLTVMVEARNRGYRREEMLGYFQGPQKEELDAVLFKWDQWVEQAKEVADQFAQHAGDVNAIRELTRECLELNKRYMVLCAERYTEALRNM
ncbi:MAG TPA: hypothetical protein VD866_28080 [Urbifossiella sp.]|nr:hypothetical protein [Urbifossiella sp.]